MSEVAKWSDLINDRRQLYLCVKKEQKNISQGGHMDLQQYPFSYPVALTPISIEEVDFTKDRLSGSNNAKTVKNYILEKMDEFSKKTVNGISNSKLVPLDSVKIEKRIISFTLYSMAELATPGRSMRLLSQLLLEEPYFQKLLVQKKLFKSFVSIENTKAHSESKIIDASSISDVELVKGLIDLLPLPEYSITKKQRKALDSMKVLAAEAGIIPI